MGARGPLAKKPDLAQGHRSRSLTVLEPSKAPVVPDPPDGLAAASVAIWETFWRSDVAMAAQQPIHLAALAQWIADIDERARVTPAFRKKRVVTGSQGQPVLNPLAGYIDKLNGRIDKAEAKFGMNPMAASRLGLTAAQAQITALDLNRMLERGDRDVIDGAAEWADGYEDA